MHSVSPECQHSYAAVSWKWLILNEIHTQFRICTRTVELIECVGLDHAHIQMKPFRWLVFWWFDRFYICCFVSFAWHRVKDQILTTGISKTKIQRPNDVQNIKIHMKRSLNNFTIFLNSLWALFDCYRWWNVHICNEVLIRSVLYVWIVFVPQIVADRTQMNLSRLEKQCIWSWTSFCWKVWTMADQLDVYGTQNALRLIAIDQKPRSGEPADISLISLVATALLDSNKCNAIQFIYIDIRKYRLPSIVINIDLNCNELLRRGFEFSDCYHINTNRHWWNIYLYSVQTHLYRARVKHVCNSHVCIVRLKSTWH